ncbi:hydroxymethylglutaryl-CoA lyase [Planctomycetota bacterium]|nr:hydroxymethylglutaryl-CoA lyase [Planctomycetota bacterium]
MSQITLTECPRDAFQGFPSFIPTDRKTAYINRLIKSGVRRIDFGSFVSPKAIPQMADTASVFENLKTRDDLYLIGIIANLRGMEGIIAANHKFGRASKRKIHAGGFPLSVNETFQQRNTNRSIDQALDELMLIQNLADPAGVELVVYLSMAFGNPYGEPHDSARVVEFAKRAHELGAVTVQLADTVGVATAEQVGETFEAVQSAVPEVEVGVHLHATRDTLEAKVKAALDAGCRLFDSAIGGIGGCPFAEDDLVGNIDTMQLLPVLKEYGIEAPYDVERILDCAAEAQEIQRTYGTKNHADD